MNRQSKIQREETDALFSAERIADLTSEELIVHARQYYASGFPNPNRYDCPAPGVIADCVSNGLLPHDDLRTHLFTCSECFGEYRQALAQHRSAVAATPALWWDRLAVGFRKYCLPVLATASLLAAVALFVHRREAPAPSVAHHTAPAPADSATPLDQEATAKIAASPAPARPVTPSQPARPSAPNASHELMDRAVIKVDLDDYLTLRDPSSLEDGAERFVSLPATPTRLSLRLPETAAAGHYAVSLVDAYGQILLTRYARSRDGVTLAVSLDLRGIAPKKYRLCLAREGEAPAYVPVQITNPRT